MTIVVSDRVKDNDPIKYDVFIGCVGFETRARFVLESLQGARIDKIVGLEFSDRQVFDFEKNRALFKERDALFYPAKSTEISKMLDEVIDFSKTNSDFYIAIDISSLSRELIAECLGELIDKCNKNGTVANVTVLYSPAEFVKPLETTLPVTSLGAVTPRYAGFTVNPELPTVGVVGLGYEYARALGAIEFVDPSDKWFFFPTGVDLQYDHSVSHINKDLMKHYVSPRNLIDYDVYDPYDLLISFRSLLTGLIRNHRVVIFPFGPKIFFLVSLVLADLLGKEISVWRVSGGQSEEAINRIPNGRRVTFRFLIDGKNAE